jgi:hypothetical protein
VPRRIEERLNQLGSREIALDFQRIRRSFLTKGGDRQDQ